MLSFYAQTLDELKAWLADHQEPAFRAEQLLEWVYGKGVRDWERMSNISKKLRGELSQHFRLSCLERARIQDSDDGETFKFLWRLYDGRLVESVLICSGERRTVCVSSQVGCPARCAFCASGKKGLIRDLGVDEIVEQVVHIDDYLREKGERVSHIVFMGMGEPLRNYDAVMKAIRLLNAPQMLNISQRRITVSTVGVLEEIVRMSREGLKVNLVLSLHAPNQKVRQKIIPYARQYDLSDLLAAMESYAEETKRDITYEYTLLAGINDQPEHARELVTLLRGKQCTVNLIPYNPVAGLLLKKPARPVIEEFRSILDEAGIVNTCRYTKGDDIAAACGQLALQESS
jgi:23S rRNA (adenine2503-C2)-methyltransferase